MKSRKISAYGLRNLRKRHYSPRVELLEPRIAMHGAGIEVEAYGSYRPLDGTIVSTTSPTVRITIPEEHLGRRVRVWLDDLDRETPREDITDLFPTLDVTGIESATLDLGLGAHSIEVRAGNHLAEATMLNIRDEMSVVSSPLFRDYKFDSKLDARYEKQALLLNFLDGTSLAAISDFLGREQLRPLDIVVPMKIVRVETPEGFDPVSLADVLMSRNDVYLEGAVPNFAMSINEIDVEGEALPKRLIDTYKSDTGGFYTGQGTTIEDFAEAKAFRPHFYMDTFAGHRLASALVGTNSASVAVAVIDTGFGNGTNHTDIPATAIVSPTDGRLLNANATGQQETTSVVELKDIVDLQPTGGHGTAVAAAVAGRGAVNLGTGPHVQVRPLRSRGNVVGEKFSPDMGSVVAALQAAALDAKVAVVNTSLGQTAAGTTNIFADVTNQLRTNNKVWVIAWGNEGTDQNPPLPASLAPGPAVRTATDPLILTVSSTGTMNPISGPETLAEKSNFGPRTSVSAPGEKIVLPQSDGTLREFSGTSFAAPFVAGLAGEMIYADRNYTSDAAKRFTPLQIIELIEATADDLGSTITVPLRTKPNNNPNNGHDSLFGHGRINVWKALLAVANRGIAFQTTEFPSLRTISETATTWYGFKIRTNQPGATVWLDGEQLTDKDATMPGSPNISSYAGVQPHTEKFTISQSNVPRLLDRGVVPIGTERGEYVTTFSVRSSALTGRRALNLRIGNDASVPAYFTLPLDLSAMRANQVAGVTFDDFVFEISPADFGDAPDTPAPSKDASDKPGYPTILRHENGTIVENGARHLNSNFEWLGRGSSRVSVSPEVNANTYTDADGRPNLIRNGSSIVHDLDGLDDGVRFFPLTYQTGSEKGIMELTVSVADHNMGRIPSGDLSRYENHPDKLLYVNAWMDWNGNGMFEETNREHVIKGLRLNPLEKFGVIDNTSTKRIELTADENTATLSSTIKVGTIGTGTIHARVRLDYGENAGQNDKLKMFVGDPALNLASGPAQYGEVEDYQISVDFGDAKDPFRTVAGEYPTKYTPGKTPADRPIVDGARHLDTTKEWLGAAVTREFAAHGAAAGDADDGKPNLGIDGKGEDFDRGDDTIVEYSGLSRLLKVSYTVTSSIASHGFTSAVTPAVSRGKGRYDAAEPSKSIYVNIWSDWNGNGSWDDKGEHVLVNSAIDPSTFGPDGKYTLGEKFVDHNSNGVYDDPDFGSFTDFAGINSRSFVSRFSPPSEMTVASKFYVRTRLTYGETVTGPTTLAGAYSVEPTRYLSGPRGAALFGEVEDVAAFTGSIHGLKWQDFKVDGVRDVRLEPGINDWMITLFAKSGPTLTFIAARATVPFDADNDGIISPGAEWGYYMFEGLPPGTYVVAEGKLPLWTQMFPSATTPGSEALPKDKLGTHSPFGHLVVLGLGGSVIGKDFGNAPPVSGSTPGVSSAQATGSYTTGGSRASTDVVATSQSYSSTGYEEFKIDESASASEVASGDSQQWTRAPISMHPARKTRAEEAADDDLEQLLDLLAIDRR